LGETASSDEREAFIEHWVEETLWYRAARKEIRLDSDMRRQLKHFRRELIIGKYQDRALPKPSLVNENDILKYYKNNIDLYKTQEVAVFIALYACNDEKTADELYRELRDEQRSSPASEYCLLKKSECHDAFKSALFDKNVSGPLSPIPLRRNYYVINVLERYSENSVLRLEHVRDDIIQKLRIEALMDAHHKKLKDLKEDVNVKIY
jgi:hypothetical protein